MECLLTLYFLLCNDSGLNHCVENQRMTLSGAMFYVQQHYASDTNSFSRLKYQFLVSF